LIITLLLLGFVIVIEQFVLALGARVEETQLNPLITSPSVKLIEAV
jgi:hypothetical protein